MRGWKGRVERCSETDEVGDDWNGMSGKEVAERTSFRLTTTSASAAVETSPFAVIGRAGLDSDDFAVCLCGGGLGYTTCVAIAGECDGQECREEEFNTSDHDQDGEDIRKRRKRV